MTDTGADLLGRARRLGPLIAELEDEMEQARHMPDRLAQAFLKAGLYRMWVPRGLGGDELYPIAYFEVVEEISRASGAAGWNLMIGSSFGLFAAGLGAASAQAVFHPDTIMAGQINETTGRAVAVDGGYRVTGRWAFGSGIHQSTHVLSSVNVFDGDTPRWKADGAQEARFVIVPRADVVVHDSWYTLGLAGTGSNDYSIEDAFVPKAMSFERGDNRHQAGPLYKLLNGFRYVLPVPMLGIARGAIDAFRDIALTRKSRSGGLPKDTELAQIALAHAEGVLAGGRSALWSAVADMYASAERGEAVTQAQDHRASLATVMAGKAAVEAVDIVFEAAGGGSVYKKHPLERRFRDIHTGRQHAAMSDARLAGLGKALFTQD